MSDADTDPGTDQLLDALPMGYARHEIILDGDGEPVDYRFLDVNPAFEEMTGLDGEDIVGQTVREVLPDLEERWIDRYGRVALTRKPDRFEQFSAPLGRHYQVHAFSPEHGEFVTLFLDITKQKKTEQRLRDSLRMLSTLAEQTLFGIYVIQDDRFRYVNPAFARISGYERDEIENQMGLEELVAPEDREKVRTAIGERLDGETTSLRYTFQGLTKEGERVEVEVYGTGTELDGKPAISGVLLDISDKKELERQLVESQKMEAVGLLASGIAHDFNNVLTTIQGHARLLLDGPGVPDELPEHLEGILKATEHATGFTRQLLTFSRGEAGPEADSIDLDEVISEMSDMLDRMTGDDVRIDVQLNADAPWVKFPASHVEQILMNLVVNARDAMPGGGEITVRTTEVRLDENYASTHLEVKPGEYVELSVIDTGVGIPPEEQDHIFEPFFTTKEPGKGTGLGLSTVYGIVNRNEGYIWVYSEPGDGTHVKVQLPRTQEEPVPDRDEEAESVPVTLKGTEQILLVDDDAGVRSVSEKILERYGYAMTAAADADEALDHSREALEAFDLLITDVVLAGGTGPDLARQLGRASPHLPVIFMSGHAEQAVRRDYGLTGDVPFLEKPFNPRELVETARRVLDASDPEPARSA